MADAGSDDDVNGGDDFNVEDGDVFVSCSLCSVMFHQTILYISNFLSTIN